MDILVTGANGFIGTYLVKELKKEGHRVIGHKHEMGDLTKKDTIEQYKGIDIIFHLAAKTYVPKSWEMPGVYLNDNNTMLINILEFCRKTGAKCVFISTYLYGQPEYLPVDEEHKCVAISPYHLCKKIGEEICEFYSRNFGVNVAVIRPFNVYGKGQNKEFLLPKVYEQVVDADSEIIEVFNLAPKRDYIYVEDVTEALVRLIPYINGFEVYNMGSGKSYSVKEVIEIIQGELKTQKTIIEKFAERKNDVMDCVADISRLEKTIGKLRITSLSEGIHKWHMENEK